MEASDQPKLIKKKKGRIKLIPQFTRRRRKDSHCLNCGTNFSIEFNYCPNCGQENNHNRASFSTLIVDFFHNYFSFDSKFSNSLLPFFFDPGYLTDKFVAGKRASFVNPVRLYLIISLVFFFVFSMISSDIVQRSIDDIEDASESLSDSSKVELDKIMGGDLSALQSDSIINLIPESAEDNKNISFSYQKPDSTNEFLTEENIALYLGLRQNQNLELEEVIDTLNTTSLSSFQVNLVRQLVRIDRAEGQIVVSHILKNVPLMMLIIIPILALFLKLLYIRQHQFYITHLIHVLYLHSFAYVIYGFGFVMAMYWFPDAAFWIILVSFLLVCFHSYRSFLKVYDQKWFKTLVKFLITGFVYSWLLLTAVLIEMFFSVVTY